MLCCLEEFGVTHLPLMALAADWAAREHAIFPNAQQRFEVTIDPDIDVLPVLGQTKCSRSMAVSVVSTAPMGSEFISLRGWMAKVRICDVTRSQCGER